MSNDWAIRRAIGNASEKVHEDGTFIVNGLRANNYLRSDDIIGAMNSTQLAEVQAAIDRSDQTRICLLYTSPSPRDGLLSRMPSSA